MKDRIFKTVKCLICKSKGTVRADYDFPKTMRVCNSCGGEFNTSRDITFNPKDFN